MPSGIGTKEIAKRYPCVDGLIAKTTTQEGHKENLVPTKGSVVSRRLKAGL